MSCLLSPFDLSGRMLRNRVAMAPLTRSRAQTGIADERTALYYAQRATAGLIVSEGTPISAQGTGYLFVPGIYSAEQVRGWRLVTDSVHALGGTIFAQIWHVGRVSHASLQPDGLAPVSSTGKRAVGAQAFAFGPDGTPGFVEASEPRALTTDEVARVVRDYAAAARNAIEAGFDGVEIHGANGYLVEQFINPALNDRTDRYGGATMEGRLRFALEVVDAVAAEIGAARTAIRLSPYAQAFDMPLYDDIDATYLALAEALAERGIAYVHLMDHTGWSAERDGPQAAGFGALMPQLRKALGRTALIVAGGLSGARAEELIGAGLIDIAAFGRPFIANPDLVERLRHGWPLAKPDRATFYGGGAEGYVDYPPFTG